jgi:hypothetical protein
MPGRVSWNGGWSGEGKNYTIVYELPGDHVARLFDLSPENLAVSTCRRSWTQAYPVDTQSDPKCPDSIDDESNDTARAPSARVGASSSSQTGAWCGTASDSATSSDSHPGTRFAPDPSAREVERSSSNLCPKVSGTDDVGRQPDKHCWTHRWSDGWVAEISARVVPAGEDLPESNGFHGYGWMVDNIIATGSPYSEVTS